MRNIPTIMTEDNKYVYGRRYIEEITNAVYGNQTSANVDGELVEILSSVRTDDSWMVVVRKGFQ